MAANDDDDDVAAGRAARFSHGVYAKPAALKDQPYHHSVNLFLAESSCARGARRASDVGQQSDRRSG